MTLSFWDKRYCLHQHTRIDQNGKETCADCGSLVKQWEVKDVQDRSQL